jgi:hypothetical protein
VHHRPSRRLVRAALAVAVAAVLAPFGGAPSPAGAIVVPICFPVADTPVQYFANFGDPRGGGRLHEGEDIMGQKGFRIVAPVSGVILSGTDGIRWSGTGHSDHSVRMRGDDGYFYAFLHMNNDTPGTDDGRATYAQTFGPGIAPGTRVGAGQLLGYMGDSGNAEGSGAHLHFEMRSGTSIWASTAFDPFDSLQAARSCVGVSSPTRALTALGGATTSDPDMASSAAGTWDVVARGADNALWHRAWTGQTFTSWATLGGASRSGPALVSPATGRLDLFIRGGDDALWQRTRVDGTWGPWRSLGGRILSDPDAASSGGGEIVVTARGGDGAAWFRTFDGAAWSAWQTAGGGIQSSASVASTGAGTFDLFAQGMDAALWRRTSTGGTWGPWRRVGGAITADPDAAVVQGVIHIVVRGTDGRLYHFPDAESPGFRLVTATPVTGGPGLTSMGGTRLDVTVRGPGDALFQGWWEGPGSSW